MSVANGWLWAMLGSAGAALVVTLTQRAGRLGSPLTTRSIPRATRRGYFGAHRAGPPVHSHQGIDLVASHGAAVLAVGDGMIVETNPGLGKVVRKLALDSRGAWSTDGELIDSIVYADLGTTAADVGDHLQKGDVIALVGPAGFVHFAVKQRQGTRETFIDPALAGFAYRDSSTENA